MIRRSSGFQPFVVVCVAVFFVITIRPEAQTPLLTRHVREAVADGKAPLVGHLPADRPMRLVLVLPLRDREGLETFLQEVDDPSSPAYHRFLTVEEFAERFGPTQSDYESVIQFARKSGFAIEKTSRNRLNLDVTAPVAAIEQALHITMGVYQHPTEDRTFYAPDREPTAESPIALWHIAGLENYAIPRPTLARRRSDTGRVISEATTGSCPQASFCGSDMRAAYYGGTALTGSGQSVGLLEYLGTDLADLDTYYANAGQTNNVPITLVSVDGTSTGCLAYQGCDDTEQTLDMTQALGMAPGLSSLVMYVGSSDAALLNGMATAKPLNAQLSASWVWGPPSDPQTDDPYFEEFAAQGQNYFNAAGDWGDWTQSLLENGEIYPADDVYVTSVGGTDLNTKNAGGAWKSETAWSDTGGGISPDDFTIPSWQTSAAAGCASCSQAYRNGPDVAANSNFTFYVCADQTTCTANEYGGTSFAAPMWAGYMALVNEQAVNNGEKTLGFINPTLYSIGLSSSYSSDLHDITSGNNGYAATSGYDLDTGWGSPNGSALIDALAGPAIPSFSLTANGTALRITTGHSGESTITVVPVNGFAGSVTLTASGLPTGVTAGFSPDPANSTSVLTLTVDGGTAAATSTVTITGASGSLTSETTLQLTVLAGGHIHIMRTP